MQALPVILPVRYAVIGETVVFRTAPGTKLTAAMRRSVVAFEADRWDPCGAWGWSVLVQGVASEVTDPTLQAAARGLLANDLPFLDGEVARVVAVEPAFLSGRAFGAIPEDPAELAPIGGGPLHPSSPSRVAPPSRLRRRPPERRRRRHHQGDREGRHHPDVEQERP